MNVRQAGAPSRDFDLERAASEGFSKFAKEAFPPDMTRLERLKCRLYPRITFFFDGTGNNLYQELEKPEHEQALTNVAKLYLAAVNDKQRLGATSTDIPGVGTPFRIPRVMDGYAPFLRDDPGGAAGLGLGRGGKMRIDYAFSELHMILQQDWGRDTIRHMPYVSVAVFGFSRGATEARAFVRHLVKRCGRDDKGLFLFGSNLGAAVTLRITFMGLFDTVASV
ncbi:MAG TPA: DUF2235 domain-containing protein, partial [Trinickia sp.]|nr:DUF2235 domain-containing protein [Trinickia sp.]